MRTLKLQDKSFCELVDQLKKNTEFSILIKPIESKPISSLRQILRKLPVAALKLLARSHNIPVTAKVKKDELILELYAKLTSDIHFAEIFFNLSVPQRQAFEKIMSVDCLPLEVCISQHLDLLDLRKLGYIQYYNFDDGNYACVSDEIKNSHRYLCQSGKLGELTRASHLYNYTAAAVNLYGILRISDLIGIFNGNEYRITNSSEYLYLIQKYFSNSEKSNFFVFEDCVVSASLRGKDLSEIKKMAAENENKPRFSPVKQVFLKYTDPLYFDTTPELSALEWFLVKKFPENPAVVDEIIERISLHVREGNPFEEYVKIFKDWELEFDQDNMAKLLDYISRFSYTARTWKNNGFTQAEIDLFRKNTRISAKVGRNDLCVCGSGRKYKKCCGR